jgi:hypothetical protein
VTKGCTKGRGRGETGRNKEEAREEETGRIKEGR